jgi:L-amino acid N-acyltransferase YncA
MTTAAHKRKGLAHKLLRHALASLFNAEKTSIYACITDGNTSSEKLFKKLGFQRI